jgi:glycosyltransferase involved in cell wall biosynthesis
VGASSDESAVNGRQSAVRIRMASTLYICYFGLREPLVQTQVLPYLRELTRPVNFNAKTQGDEDAENTENSHATARKEVKTGVEKPGSPIQVSLLTFEPDFKNNWSKEQIAEEKAKLAAEGIDWLCLAYHKWPSVPATIYDIVRGTMFVTRFIAKRKPDILHGRVHLPTLMGAAARKFSRHKPKLLFDIRGFFPEEYTEAGVWPEGGWLYRGAKRVERWLLKESNGFVVLTERARDILFPESKTTGFDKQNRPVEVIPCCVDFRRFGEINSNRRASARKNLGINGRRVVAYVGSLTGSYLLDEVAGFFAAARELDQDLFVLILTQRDKNMAEKRLAAMGFSKNDYFVDSVAPDEIPDYIAAADTAISFIKAGYSKLSCSPTKIPEYLAAGVPVISNQGVGDVDELLISNGVGVAVDHLDREHYLTALRRIKEMGDVRGRCQETARRVFDLANVGGTKYHRIYRRLLNKD